MLTRFVFGCVLTVALMVPFGASAQQEEEPQMPYVYGIYFECDVARQGLADEIFELAYLPTYSAAVDDGTIASFGWLSHHTGSKWRRLMYHSAYDLGSLMSALETVNGAVDEKYPELSRAFSEICGTHDDYIWQQATGSRGADVTVERGQVGFSAYHNCDMSHETRADEMMESVFGPIYDRQVANGNLISWGWMQHVVGGKWRRISTMTAADETRLMAARTAIIEEIGDGLEEEGKEFNSICGSHQDFIWNIVHEKP